ncbi:hypothetical protein DUNSADRAFT_2227, partial [Dunaliella salina]
GTRSDVQTEPPPPPSQRPSSARHLTYFDRLLLSSASRQAGQAASGSGRDGASPSPRPTPLVPPSQSSRPSSSLSSLRSPLTAQPSSQPLNPPPNQQPPSQPSNQQQGPGTPSVSHPHLSPSATADMHHRHPSSSSFSSEIVSGSSSSRTFVGPRTHTGALGQQQTCTTGTPRFHFSAQRWAHVIQLIRSSSFGAHRWDSSYRSLAGVRHSGLVDGPHR